MAPRPPKKWWRSCVAGVEASGSAKERLGGPPAVCGAVWRDKTPAEKRATRRAGHASGSTVPDLDPDATYALAVHAALADLTIANLALPENWGSIAKAKSIFARDDLHERNWSLVNEYESFVRRSHARGILARETAKKIFRAQPGEKL
jgi:hypothetical protein